LRPRLSTYPALEVGITQEGES
ncbi:hypothetical protein FLM9_1657, partial [Candidatus Synechococcus spongiarum]